MMMMSMTAFKDIYRIKKTFPFPAVDDTRMNIY